MVVRQKRKFAKKLHPKQAVPRLRTKKGKYLVVVLGSLFFVLAPIFPLEILVEAYLGKWTGPTLEGIEIPATILAVLMAVICGGIIGTIIWMLILSFYLTVDEWNELDRIREPYFPVLTEVITGTSRVIFRWKLAREEWWKNR